MTATNRKLKLVINGNKLLDRLPERWRWVPHNCIAHPVSEILFHLGLGSYGNKLHDLTLPTHKKGEGRG